MASGYDKICTIRSFGNQGCNRSSCIVNDRIHPRIICYIQRRNRSCIHVDCRSAARISMILNIQGIYRSTICQSVCRTICRGCNMSGIRNADWTLKILNAGSRLIINFYVSFNFTDGSLIDNFSTRSIHRSGDISGRWNSQRAISHSIVTIVFRWNRRIPRNINCFCNYTHGIHAKQFYNHHNH